LPPLRARAIGQILVYPMTDPAAHILGPGEQGSGRPAYPSLCDEWADWRPVLPASLMRSFGLGLLPRGTVQGGRRGRTGFGVAGLSGADGVVPLHHGGAGFLGVVWRTLQRVWWGAADPLDRIETLGYNKGYYGLTAGMSQIREEELPAEAAEALRDWRMCPAAAATLSGLPPALVVTAGWDVLRDEGTTYCERLKKEETSGALNGGAHTRCLHFDDAFHGFYGIRSDMLP